MSTTPNPTATTQQDKTSLPSDKDLEHHSPSFDHDDEYQHQVVYHGGTEDIEPTLGWRTWTVYASVCFLAFGTNYAVSATGFWMSYVVQTIGSPKISIWFADGGMVSQVALTPLVGQLSDFGSPSRRVLVCLLAGLGAMGCIVAGSAHNMHVGIVGVVFAGMSIMSYFVQFAIVGDIMPHRMRGIAQGSLYAILGCGAIVNNTAGGAFIRDNAGGAGGWRWNLYMAAILQGTGIALILIFYRPHRTNDPNELPYFTRLRQRIDIVGNLLWMAAFIPLMMGLIWGGNTYAWKSAPVIVCLVLGSVMGICCAFHQTFIKKDGIFHHGLFRHRNFALSIVGIFIEGVVYVTFLIFTPQQVGTLYDSRPVWIGLHFSICLIFASISSSASGWYSKRFRRVKELLVIGYLLIAGACIGFALCGADPKYSNVNYGMMVLAGFGFGPPEGLLLAIGQLAVAPEFSGIASAHIIGIRSMGGTIGAAIASGIFTAKLTKKLPNTIAQYALTAGVSSESVDAVVSAVAASNGVSVSVPGITDAQMMAAQLGRLNAYAKSFAYIFWSVLPWAVVGAIALAFLGSVREQMNWVIDAPVESLDALGLAHNDQSSVSAREKEAPPA